MLTYDFENVDGPIYDYLYKCIKSDILSGNLKPNEKLPSKRAFAKNNGISTITIQNALDQLISEGYIYALPRKGYYVSNIEGMTRQPVAAGAGGDIRIPKEEAVEHDFSGNGIDPENFPFSVWTKISREIMSDRKEDLMTISPASGVRELREAIAEHLRSFRGMLVDPDQIVIGAGTEYLYGLIIQLLGNRKYAIENPGYRKLTRLYRQRGVACQFVTLDEKGVTASGLEAVGAEVAHICPNHHFPTGITMPVGRRYEILAWANETEDRYIIEDDYDSEFRIEGKPIPTLFSIDNCEKVIYMNTFSKSLTPTIRISYMILPVHLVNRFSREMSFYACTVSNFEQYTLAQFIARGFFEKHINRMRRYYTRQRKKLVELIQGSDLGTACRIIENDSGLHFLVQLKTELSDQVIEQKMMERGVKIRALSDYYFEKKNCRQHCFIVNYSNLKIESAQEVMRLLRETLQNLK
jgi:GntR family transcriptional regulator/MocR family aminotransferase